MSKFLPIMQREIAGYFFSPVAYAVLAIYLLLNGFLFLRFNFLPGAESSLRNSMEMAPYVLLAFLPILTMRLISEEYRSGTIETLMTAPLGETAIVLGKFFGALFFYLVMLASTLVFAVIVGMFGRLDPGLLLCSYLGLLLVGGLYIAVGLFFSACTKTQIIAAVCTIVVLLVFTLFAHLLAMEASGVLKLVIHHLSIKSHYDDFNRGLLDTNHVVFFLTTTGLFLFLAVKMLETRRWR